MTDRIRRVWAVIDGKEFEAIPTGNKDEYVLDILASEVFSSNRPDDMYRVTINAKDWAENIGSVDNYDPKYGHYLDIEIREHIEYDEIEEDPLPDPMIAWLLNENYEPIRVIDSFETFIWTDRFCDVGDFELYLPMNIEIFQDLKIGYYIAIRNSDRLMVIESIKLSTNATNGHHITVKGRSLESILDRRIVWDETEVKNNMQEAVEKLITEAIIKPKNKDRTIPLYTFKRSTDPRITKLKILRKYFGDNLLELIKNLCNYKDIGFKVLPKGRGGFEFSLYEGVDHSYEQSDNPWVIFSPYYENLTSSEDIRNYQDYKNVGLVSTEYDDPLLKDVDEDGNEIPEEELKKKREIILEVISKEDEKTGLNRREMLIENNLPEQGEIETEEDPETGEKRDPTEEEVEADKNKFKNQLKNAALTELKTTQDVEVFTGEIDPSRQFVYGVDFFIGDIVQVENEYDYKKVMRISEVVRSHDSDGIKITPAFVDLHPPEDDEDEKALEEEKENEKK